MVFGQYLRQLRNQAGLSLRELATALDVNFTYVKQDRTWPRGTSQ